MECNWQAITITTRLRHDYVRDVIYCDLNYCDPTLILANKIDIVDDNTVNNQLINQNWIPCILQVLIFIITIIDFWECVAICRSGMGKGRTNREFFC